MFVDVDVLTAVSSLAFALYLAQKLRLLDLIVYSLTREFNILCEDI